MIKKLDQKIKKRREKIKKCGKKIKKKDKIESSTQPLGVSEMLF